MPTSFTWGTAFTYIFIGACIGFGLWLVTKVFK